MPSPCRDRAGFTLVELLVVISIIAVLAGMLLPMTRIVRDAARSTVCAGNLRQLGMAFHAYADEHEGRFPPFSNHPDPTDHGQYYPNLLSDGGYLEVERWRSPLYGVADGGIWRCPSLPYGLAGSSGGYGMLENAIHGGYYLKSILRGQIGAASGRLLLADAEWNQGAGTTWKGWPSVSCPMPGCAGTWDNRRRAAARHGQGRRANVCFADGHVAPVPFADLLTNLNDVFRHYRP